MAAAVYFLCALTSLICTILLIRSYLKNHVKLIFWSAICFCGQLLSNCILFFDLILFPQVDFSIARLIPAFIGALLLTYSLIWDVT
jgi:hypothetical protein